VHVFDSLNENYDRFSVNTSSLPQEVPIAASLTTRSYMLGSLGRKRFSQVGVTAQAGTVQSDFSISVSTDDPDDSQTSMLVSDQTGATIDADDTIDARVRVGGLRGHNARVTIEPRIGRPRIRGVSMQGTVTNRATQTQS
jgi:hypothetical protein